MATGVWSPCHASVPECILSAMPLLQILPVDTSRPSVIAVLVTAAGVVFFGGLFRSRLSNQRPGRSEMENWTVFTLGPALGLGAFVFVLVVQVVEIIQGR
jgi:hypothetical protein